MQSIALISQCGFWDEHYDGVFWRCSWNEHLCL